MNFSARVIAIQEGLVTIRREESAEKSLHPLTKNELVYIHPDIRGGGNERIMAEILHIRGSQATAQLFEPADGIGIGDAVEQSGELLSVTLAPGLLGMVYDGLQHPLKSLAVSHGYFLPRGVHPEALDAERIWAFVPTAKTGDMVYAGDVLGQVLEGHICHSIFVPFSLRGACKVKTIRTGSYTITQVVAELLREDGQVEQVTMRQRWPIRRPLPQSLLEAGRAARLYPSWPMLTGIRMIDTFFPVARGGTACIPGPFGAGKTVLQNLIARHANVDVVIVVACGERAGEVVETIAEFPTLKDPVGGGSLMDRTIIICNTSSMPVAAREASIYTGITLGEYYRQMGLHVLLLADSTSRWAQAMRETSGRMEEIPGEEGYPAYLDSAIKGVYERAGVIQPPQGAVGSLTMIGTVSPAGGNFEEPVTQSTLGTVKTFLGLSYDRAYRRFYPAIDPLISWSRYHPQLKDWFEEHQEVGWSVKVAEITALLHRGEDISRMMQVTGEEGITLEDFITYQKALFFDMVYLQQDAFDAVDASTSIARQKENFALAYAVIQAALPLNSKQEVRDVFLKLTGLFRNLNYTSADSEAFRTLQQEIIHLRDGCTTMQP